MLEVKGISKSFADNLIFKDVSFKVYQAEILGLVGKSGSGKTTISNCITGMETCDQGQILWNNCDLETLTKKEKRETICSNIQMIFQNAQNVLHPLKYVRTIFDETVRSINKIKDEPAEYDYEKVLEAVDLSPKYLNKKTTEMSGGEKQRVSIARTLLVKPGMILADEPFSSVDAISKRNIADILKKAVNKGIGMVLITHDIDYALMYCDRIAFINDKSLKIFNDLSNKDEIYKTISKGLI